ncbi:FRG domain-containing protein [Cryobacterium shii]|uniref:FRG domain-containing protein n=1 Tax=Cryobacterium shii TaxID=1259235 RepID=A0AAQ2HFQ2_9MICO|nr:FRG domain-containing protein [Cryobacterium shii]TFC48932.1 FRG domain-containing protein [Cryobacterium shii]
MPRDVGWIWKTTGWYVEPPTSRDVMSVLGSIGVFSSDQRFAWRGMSSADYPLWSSLHRELGSNSTEADVRAAETQLLWEARKWGLGTQPTGHVDDLQLLSDLQHYGIATRLMDFTNNPMTALWFACQNPTQGSISRSGLLLALNITGWPKYSTLASPQGVTWGQLENPMGTRLQNALRVNAPFVVESSNPNDRLRAQEGFFVAGKVPVKDAGLPIGTSGIRLEHVTPFLGLNVAHAYGNPELLDTKLKAERRRGAPGALPFVAVVIKARLKQKLLQYLENTYNRSASVLFPDYAGFQEFGREVRSRGAVV